VTLNIKCVVSKRKCTYMMGLSVFPINLVHGIV